ncbi:Sodium/hydrogen exchanger 3, partial [Globisporangium splendens]
MVYVFMGTSVIMLFTGHVAKSEGTALRVDDIDWKFIVLTLAACVVARFFNIFPLLGLSNCSRSTPDKISVKYMTVIWFAGLRGSIAFALAKNWTYLGIKGASHRKLIESTTLMVVLFTTIVIGGLTGPFLSMLGVVNQEKKHEDTDDTGSTTDDSVASPAPPRLQTRHVPRRSMHYIVSHGETPFTEVPTQESTTTAVEPLEMLGPNAILTPRPQFRDSSSDSEDDDVWENRPNAATSTQPPAIQRASSNSRHESMTGVFFRSWQNFDASYMQPIFGGHSQVSSTSTATARAFTVNRQETVDPTGNVTLRELAKIEKENMV